MLCTLFKLMLCYHVSVDLNRDSLTQAQATAMADDACAFAVEPNYVIKARGSATKRLGASHIQEVPKDEAEITQDPQAEIHRRLGIPEFNMLDESPGKVLDTFY